MIIDGREIARKIFEDLKKRVGELREKNIIPHLTIILLGNDPSSESYVRQKELKAANIGALTTVYNLPVTINQEQLLSTIEQLNNDNHVHGIIVQRPLPPHIDPTKIDEAVRSEKDVDGFRHNSPFLPPLGIAVYKILTQVGKLSNKKIVIMGKGKTGGSPVMQVLKQRDIPFTLTDSKTENPEKIISEADIIVAAVGKPNIITKTMIKKGVVLIGIGMHKGEDGKLHGDYDEEQIKDIASFYTPIPGGVGPVNVAMLLSNLVTAAEKNTKISPLT